MQDQIELFELVNVSSKGKTIDEAFQEFHEKNPHVYRNLRFLALQAVQAGRKRIGIGFLFERIRWEYMIHTTHSDYKMNNNFRSRYARLLMLNESQLQDVFETRILKSKDGRRRRLIATSR